MLKKKMQREGVFREMKRRRFYEKPSENRTGKKLKRFIAPASSLARKPNARDLSLHRAGRRCNQAERLGVAHLRSGAEVRLKRDGKLHEPRGHFRTKTSSGLCSLLFAQAPKLKALCVYCFLDRVAREVEGRRIVRRYCPGNSPRTVLAWKLVHVRVAGEGAQPVRSLRFENVDAHGYLTVRKCSEFKGQCVNGYQRRDKLMARSTNCSSITYSSL